MIDFLQWPALLLSIAGAWCVSGGTARQRLIGFLLFLGSNVLWLLWASGASAWAVVIANVIYMVTSVRGVFSNLPGSMR